MDKYINNKVIPLQQRVEIIIDEILIIGEITIEIEKFLKNLMVLKKIQKEDP